MGFEGQGPILDDDGKAIIGAWRDISNPSHSFAFILQSSIYHPRDYNHGERDWNWILPVLNSDPT